MAIKLHTEIDATVRISANNYDSVGEAQKAVEKAVTDALAALGTQVVVSVRI